MAMVKTRVLVPPLRIGLVANNFEMLGGWRAVRVAVAEPPLPVFVPDSFELMNPLTLVCGPLVTATMLTLAVQEPLAGMVPPFGLPKVSVVAPLVGDQVGEPPQVVLAPGVDATSRPAGRVSVKVTPVNGKLLGLASVKVNVEMALTAMGLEEKDLVRVGCPAGPQPVTVTLSTDISALVLVAPLALILKYVWLEPVAVALRVPLCRNVVSKVVEVKIWLKEPALPVVLDQTLMAGVPAEPPPQFESLR